MSTMLKEKDGEQVVESDAGIIFDTSKYDLLDDTREEIDAKVKELRTFVMECLGDDKEKKVSVSFLKPTGESDDKMFPVVSIHANYGKANKADNFQKVIQRVSDQGGVFVGDINRKAAVDNPEHAGKISGVESFANKEDGSQYVSLATERDEAVAFNQSTLDVVFCSSTFCLDKSFAVAARGGLFLPLSASLASIEEQEKSEAKQDQYVENGSSGSRPSMC